MASMVLLLKSGEQYRARESQLIGGFLVIIDADAGVRRTFAAEAVKRLDEFPEDGARMTLSKASKVRP